MSAFFSTIGVVKKLVAGLLIAFAILVSLFGLSVLGTPDSKLLHRFDDTEIALIQAAKGFVAEFGVRNSRLPSPDEFEIWMKSKAHEYPRFEGKGVNYVTGSFPIELTESFGSAPQGAFALSFWGRDGWVYFASWFGDGSVGYPEGSLYGRKGGYSALCLLLAVLLGGFGIALFRSAVG